MKKRLLSPPPPHVAEFQCNRRDPRRQKSFWMWDLHRFTRLFQQKNCLNFSRLTFWTPQGLEIGSKFDAVSSKGMFIHWTYKILLQMVFRIQKGGWKNSCVDGNGLSASNGPLDGAPDPGMSWDPNLCSKIGAKSYQCSKKLCNLASKTRFMVLWHIIAMFQDTVILSSLGATWWLSMLAPKCSQKNNYDPVTFYFGFPTGKKCKPSSPG